MQLYHFTPDAFLSIAANEIDQSFFGPSTLAAVKRVQMNLTDDSDGDGIVTEGLVEHINRAVGRLPAFRVRVEVEDETTGARLPGLTAHLVHARGPGDEDTFAATETDIKGTAELAWDVKTLTLGKGRRAILVRILDPEGRLLAASPTREYPGPEESFHFAIRQDAGDDVWRATVEVRSARTQEPVAGVIVRLADWDIAGDDALGSQVSGADGIARFEFRDADFRKTDAERGGPDLIARVYERSGRLLGISKRRMNAGRDEHMSLEAIEPGTPRITGRAVLSPEWEPGVRIEAFADAELTQPVGSAKTGEGGLFEIVVAGDLPDQVCFRWSQGGHKGRSPRLQPFSTAATIRLHVYRRWEGEPRGGETFLATVRSSSGRPAVGLTAALLESTILRCQIRGESVTSATGTAPITYDAADLFMERPDLRIVVFDADGVPLVESASATVEIPGLLAPTETLFEKVADAFRKEGLDGPGDLGLSARDLLDLAGRAGLPATAVAAYDAARTVSAKVGLPAEAVFALAGSPASDIRLALEQAVERGMASPSLLAPSGDPVAKLAAARAKAVASRDLGRGSLDAFLGARIEDEKAREELARIILETGGLPAIREKLEERGLSTPQTLFLLDLHAIAGVNADLAKVVVAQPGEDLALLGRAGWTKALEEAGEADKAPDAPAFQVLVAAHDRRAQRLFPEKAFRAQIEKHGEAEWAQRIGRYLAKHSDRGFNSPLPLPGASDADPDEEAEARAVAAFSGLDDLTGDLELAASLMSAGFTSSARIATLGPAEFAASVPAVVEADAGTLERIHTRALVRAQATNIAASWLPVTPKPSPCGCEECRSIFGPAAYLFELLALLKRYDLLDRLKSVRPDVTRYDLSCRNTKVECPQIDLINEILEDLIRSVQFEDTKCLPSHRQAQGNSEERRAIPQNQPRDEIIGVLSSADKARFPWTLPYDYRLDRARSARELLITEPEDFALKLWRHAVASGERADEATSTLGLEALGLPRGQVELIVTGESSATAWGGALDGQIANGSVGLAEIARTARTDYETLENVLDTMFVRRGVGASLRIEPEDFCATGETPRLTGQGQLTEVLGRFHRFERLRRHLDWSVRDLDEALRWLGGDLDARVLSQIGVLGFLQRRLGTEPVELLALLRDPDDILPETLRPRHTISAFEAQFGPGSPDFMGLDADALAARIANAAGAPLAAVDLVFESGLLSPSSRPADLLAGTDVSASQALYRQAVATTFRLSRWAQRLRVDEAEVIELAALAGLELHPSSPSDPSRSAAQLRAALRLIDLTDRSDGWPVGTAELGYLVGELAPTREHGPSATEVGAALSALRHALRQADEAAGSTSPDPREALRAAVARALAISAPEVASAAETAALAGRIAGAIEWSVVLPESAQSTEVDDTLSQLFPAWRGLPASDLPDGGTMALDGAVGTLAGALPDWLGAPPTDGWPQRELEHAATSLGEATRARIGARGTEEIDRIEQQLRAGLMQLYETALRETTRARESQGTDEISRIEQQLGDSLDMLRQAAEVPERAMVPPGPRELLARATEQVEAQLRPQLMERAEAVLPAVLASVQTLVGRQVLADWIVRTFGRSPATAAAILERMSDPDDAATPIERAFAGESGTGSARLDRSVVEARYAAVAGARPMGEASVARAETSLILDWSVQPPAPSLQGRSFVAELRVRVPRLPEHLIIETDGAVEIRVRRADTVGLPDDIWAEERLADIIVNPETSPTGQVRQTTASFESDLGGSADLVIRCTLPATGARTLRVLAPDADGALSEFQWAMLAEATRRLHRAALAVRDVQLPVAAWGALQPRSVDLGRLAAGAPLADWQAFYALADLVKRARSPEAVSSLIAFLAGEPTPRGDLPRALNLGEAELDGALPLLGVSDDTSDMVSLPPSVGLERVRAALDLLDEARKYNLPPVALARWHGAAPDEIFQWSMAALGVGLEPAEWLDMQAQVWNPVRERLRDAQLDYLVGSGRFASREAISDHLCTDVQMSPCMTTTRIQFAISACQRFVEAGRSGRVDWLTGTTDQEKQENFEREWTSLRLWPLYEARMRVEAHTENYLEPDVRPGKTPRFERFVQRMSSGPPSLRAFEQAMREYAASLTEIAHLEPIAMVTHDPDPEERRPLAFRDAELYGTHVFARTRAHPQRLYYRRILPAPDSRPTPWELIDSDLAGTHYLAVVVFGRLRLICADFSPAKNVRPTECSGQPTRSGRVAAGEPALVDYEVSLSWIDRQDGGWSKVKRSGRFPITVDVGTVPEGDVYDQGLPTKHFSPHGDRWKKVEISLKSSGDTSIDDGSSLKAYIVGDFGEQEVGDGLFGPRDLDTYSLSLERVRDEFNQIHGIKLIWNPARENEGSPGISHSDDLDISGVILNIETEYFPSIIREINSGTLFGNRYTLVEDWSSTGKSFKLQGGGGGERKWVRFEGPLFEGSEISPVRLHHTRPSESDFDIDYEVVPQSIDLTSSLAIDARVTGNDSFALRIFSVHRHPTGRVQARFRVKEKRFNELPNVVKQAWGSDWVSGEPFCYEFETKGAGLTNLRIYSDDTIEQRDPPRTGFALTTEDYSMTSHTGVAPEGQRLISNTPPSEEWLWLARTAAALGASLGIPSHVFCGGSRAATAPNSYDLTVSRCFSPGENLSTHQTPKILDERPSDSSPARTFFIERVEGEPPLEGTYSLVLQQSLPLTIVIPAGDGRATPAKARTSKAGEVTIADGLRDPRANTRPPGNGGKATRIELNWEVLAERLGGGEREIDGIRGDVLQDWGWIRPEQGGTPSVPTQPEWEFPPPVQTGDLPPFRVSSVWQFRTFWHPQAVGFRRILEAHGLARLVRIENQELAPTSDLPDQRGRVEYFGAQYGPTSAVYLPYPRDEVDFSLTGFYSEDNWELFFDCLLYGAQCLDEDGQHDEAEEIWALLLDRSLLRDEAAWRNPDLFQTAPIRYSVEMERQIDEDKERFWSDVTDTGRRRLRDDLIAQIQRISLNPYQPHLIARGWPSVYARMLQIRYCEHKIRSADAGFRLAFASDNRSLLETVSAEYDFVARLLGPFEGSLAAAETAEIGCYESLTEAPPDGSAHGVELLDPYIPADIFDGVTVDNLFGIAARRYFCVPRSEKLDELRALVADRLLNLRGCRDIDGVRRTLSLYGRRIDPMLLVRATAEGMDLDVVLGRISGARPNMQFEPLWQRAVQACERLRSFEETWLAAEERAESEEERQLQNTLDIGMQEGLLEPARQRLEDARKMLEAMQRTVESHEIRYDYYASRQKVNALEAAEGQKLVEARRADARAANDSRSASYSAAIPTVEAYIDVGAQFPMAGGPPPNPFSAAFFRGGVSSRYRGGGETAVQVYSANAEGHRNDGAEMRVEAARLGRQGGFERRWDDIVNQKMLAQKDKQKGAHDMAGAEIRVVIADLEVDLQKRRIEDGKTMRAFMRDKLGSREFHAWRASQMKQLQYQQFRVCYDLVCQAKTALIRENGLEDSPLVPDPWGSQGVGAAATLLHELEKQQERKRQTWRRLAYKTKTYSLAERDPLAFLELLQRGETVVSITEADFDEDADGHWFRTITRLSVDIPSVRGPYTNVNAVITQLKSEKRMRAYRATERSYYREGQEDPRFADDPVSGDFITTNTGMQDDGRLDQQQNSEFTAPFVGNGAVGTFRIELRPSQNHFDRPSIPDVIIRMELSCRPASDAAARGSEQARRERRRAQPHPVMVPLHSTCSNEWHRFVQGLEANGAGTLALKFDRSHVPMWLQPISDRLDLTDIYFAADGLRLAEAPAGMLSSPQQLPRFQPPDSRPGDPHMAPPMQRLRLRDPLEMGMERSLIIERDPDTQRNFEVKRGWLVCWVRGA